MKCAFIMQQAKHYAVKTLCRVLGVTRSSYYDWQASESKVVPPEALAVRRRMKALFRNVSTCFGQLIQR